MIPHLWSIRTTLPVVQSGQSSGPSFFPCRSSFWSRVWPKSCGVDRRPSVFEAHSLAANDATSDTNFDSISSAPQSVRPKALTSLLVCLRHNRSKTLHGQLYCKLFKDNYQNADKYGQHFPKSVQYSGRSELKYLKRFCLLHRPESQNLHPHRICRQMFLL